MLLTTPHQLTSSPTLAPTQLTSHLTLAPAQLTVQHSHSAPLRSLRTCPSSAFSRLPFLEVTDKPNDGADQLVGSWLPRTMSLHECTARLARPWSWRGLGGSSGGGRWLHRSHEGLLLPGVERRRGCAEGIVLNMNRGELVGITRRHSHQAVTQRVAWLQRGHELVGHVLHRVREGVISVGADPTSPGAGGGGL